MNLKSATEGFLKLGKRTASAMPDSQIDSKEKESKFSFGLYGLVTSLLLGSVAGVNWLIDPLWYSHGNILTGKNFAFNERVTKTNLFFRTKDQEKYNCIILGSSRVTTLRPSELSNHDCFNYALKGAEIPDFVSYANFLQEQNINPKIVYIGVDGLNFVEQERKEQPPISIDSLQTPSFLQAYLSSDVLLFSAMTILGVSPDPANYYDQNFEPVDFANPPVYEGQFYKPAQEQKCDLASIETFISLKKFFPHAKFVGYVPPRSAWSMINETYARGLTDCELLAFYKLSQNYDAMYDFSIPSEVTKNPRNTFDGSHYSVETNNKIAKILQGGADGDFGIRIDKYTFEDYRAVYRQKLRGFLAETGELKRWNDNPKISIDMVQ
ncbi:MAG: hypothetical protein HC939_01960 [Pleurocapsa sp. SU_5_0]|nr:hypothetical protein [Pleurocapsa sp. SU_5_0]NJO94644.1 hypothetical protein [Pleurocapsa sp. CRU_1_2]NJR47488.1 hypothetical protein [Hyellaceae cyanobacterium CSU_1_1]